MQERSSADPYARLREDAARLARKHGGNLDRLAYDPALKVRRLFDAPAIVMLDEVGKGGIRVGAGARPVGVVRFRRDGQYDILLLAGLPKSKAAKTLAHEIGHVRSDQLLSDRSERAAEVWSLAWRYEALRRQYDIK